MTSSIDKHATRNLIAFVRNFTDLLEKSLQSIQGTMRETVDGVMQGINEISEKTSAKKREANEVLVATYTNPDAEASKIMDSVQNEVNEIMEMAASGGTAAVPTLAAVPTKTGSSTVFTAVNGNEGGDKLRRGSGLFSKHMEAMETLDGDLQGMLISMMGALSRDDVIAQKIEHVVTALNAMQTSLTYLLTDFEERCKESNVERFTKELKTFVFRSYTMEDEKKIFYNVFPEERPAKSAKKVS